MHFITTHPFVALVALVIAIVVPPLICSALAYSRELDRNAREERPEEIAAFHEMLEKAGLL